MEKILLRELKKIQKRFGYLKKSELVELSKKLNMPVSKVYAASSFYTFLSMKKSRYVVRVCNNLPCMINGSERILRHLKRLLKIKPGETTKDGRFSLEVTSCIGCCNKPPSMMINDKIFTNLTEKQVSSIINKLK